MEAMTNIPATGHAFEGNFLNRPVGFSPSVVKSRTLPHDAENSPALCFYGSPGDTRVPAWNTFPSCTASSPEIGSPLG